MLNVIMLNVVMLNVILLSVMAPFSYNLGIYQFSEFVESTINESAVAARQAGLAMFGHLDLWANREESLNAHLGQQVKPEAVFLVVRNPSTNEL
jgi:hypothetical protein